MKLKILFIFCSLQIAIASCKEQVKTQAVEEIIPVTTQPVSFMQYAPTLDYSGMVASSSEAKLSFKIGGIIAHTYVKEGDHVNTGQLLATLDMTEINAQVQQSMQGADKAQRDLSRVQSLFNDTAATLEQLQNVQTQVNVSNENLRIAKFNQQYAQIHATQNGTVIKKIMNEGELASPGMPVFITNGTSGNDWVMRFGVSDKEWALLQKGSNATVNIDAYPDKIFNGTITKIAEAADPYSGTYEVEVKIFPGTQKFAAGLFATVHIKTTAQQQVAVIPVEALSEADNKNGFVYLLNADKQSVKKQAVTIAFISNNKVGIRSGLENINEIIVGGVNYLSENSKVKLVNGKQ